MLPPDVPLSYSQVSELRAGKPKVNNLGLTPEEQEVMDKVVEAYSAYQKLERQHPDDIRDFVDGVHRIQGVLAMRVVRRCYPKGWPTYKVKPQDQVNEYLPNKRKEPDENKDDLLAMLKKINSYGWHWALDDTCVIQLRKGDYSRIEFINLNDDPLEAARVALKFVKTQEGEQC